MLEILQEFNVYVIFDDGLPISASFVEEIVDLSEPMKSNCDAEIDNETLIKTVTFSKVLLCLETENIPYAVKIGLYRVKNQKDYQASKYTVANPNNLVGHFGKI
ncbi:hypothetical protein TNCV_570831 [Trichonephila clavipes]|nr:hypothetical protein TNCV_570831 [Trichonephila clavipes]